jgi:hypothetical protein
MERVEGARTPYEVYCDQCRVTFPAEARRCFHCGGPLSAPGEAARIGIPMAAPGAVPLPAPAGEAEEEGAALMVRRFGGLAVWALVALSAVLSNLCRG